MKVTYTYNQNDLYAKTAAPIKRPTGGIKQLTSHVAKQQFDTFFNSILRLDTDEVLKKAGIKRHELTKLLYDDEIDQCFDTLINNLQHSNYTLNPSEGKAADFVYQQLDTHLDALIDATIEAYELGYSVCELVWHKDIKLGIKEVAKKPIEWFEPKNNGDLIYFDERMSQGVQVDTNYKFLLMQHRPTYTEPKGKAILSRVYWLWYFKANGWQFWSKFLERFGSPILAASDVSDPAATAEALLSAHNSSVVALPDGKLDAISPNGHGEAFERYDERINNRITKYILRQTLTSGADKGGTYGQGKIHQEQQDLVFNALKKLAQKYIQSFIDRACLLAGYAPPVFAWIIETSLQSERAERDAMLVNMGVRFSDDYWIDQYDIDKKYITAQTPQTKTINPNKPNQQDKNSQVLGFLAQSKNAPKPKQFTDEQQRLEDLADNILSKGKQPLSKSQIIKAVSSAQSADDLPKNLFDVVGDKISSDEFFAQVEQAVYVADILGYADAQAEAMDEL